VHGRSAPAPRKRNVNEIGIPSSGNIGANAGAVFVAPAITCESPFARSGVARVAGCRESGNNVEAMSAQERSDAGDVFLIAVPVDQNAKRHRPRSKGWDERSSSRDEPIH